MNPNPVTATISTPAPQASAVAAGSPPGTQPAPAAPATPPTPVQIFWDVARLAFALMTRLVGVLQPIQSYYLEQSRQIMRVCTELCRIMLTIRFAPERITTAQLRHLTRARHILQALFNYTLPTPLGPRTSSSANATANQHPSASSPGARKPKSATTPSPTVPAVPEVPEVPAVPGVSSPNTLSATPLGTPISRLASSPASSHTPAASPNAPSPNTTHPSHASHDSHASYSSHNPQSAIHTPQSAIAPYIPDAVTLSQALRSATLPPNCAGALVDNPGDALVKALHQLHAVYFSLYPKTQSPSPSPSQSISSCNPQSVICNPQSEPSPSSGNPQSAICNPQSEPSPSSGNLQSAICNPQSDTPHWVAPP